MHPLIRPEHSDKAVFMNEEFMMIFGCGDIVITDQCNIREGQSMSRLGQEFVKGDVDMAHLGGHVAFSVNEIEVFLISFKSED